MRSFVAPALLLVSTTLLSQAPAKPPMPLGLWQAKTSAIAPDGKAAKHIVLSCSTQSNWLTLMGPTAEGACPKTHEVWSSNSYQFDVQCPGKPKVASVVVTFDDAEHQHGTVDLFTQPDGPAANMHMEDQSHWVSSDCGKLSESNPVMVKDSEQ